MQLGRTRLTATEQHKHLTSGACVYYGQPFYCWMPLATKRLSLSALAEVLMSATSSCPSSSRVILPGTLLWANDMLPLTVSQLWC